MVGLLLAASAHAQASTRWIDGNTDTMTDELIERRWPARAHYRF